MKRFYVLALVAATSLLPVSSASAQQGSWLTGIFLGYSASVEKDAPSGNIGGLFYGSNFVHPVIALGGEIGIHRLGSEKFDDVGFGAGEVGQHVWEVTGNVRVVGSGKVRPFGNLGAGAYWVTTTAVSGALPIQGTGTDTRFGFNLGGGLMFGPAAKKWSFGIDGRWHSVIKGLPDDSALDFVTIYAGVNVRE
jgi:hypothetical protein